MARIVVAPPVPAEPAPDLTSYRGRGRPRKNVKPLTVEDMKARLEQLRAAIKKRKKKAWGAYEDAPLDDSKIEELAKQGPVLDGHLEVSYQKESPPISPNVREWLEGDSFDHVDKPADPGVYLLWHKGRVVYVGKSYDGIMTHSMTAHVHGGRSMGNSYEIKAFDALSFIQVSEDITDICTRALVRLLRPKYNRAAKQHPLEALDKAALEAMGFAS